MGATTPNLKSVFLSMIVYVNNHLNLVISVQLSSWGFFMVLKDTLFVINLTVYCFLTPAWGIVLKCFSYLAKIYHSKYVVVKIWLASFLIIFIFSKFPKSRDPKNVVHTQSGLPFSSNASWKIQQWLTSYPKIPIRPRCVLTRSRYFIQLFHLHSIFREYNWTDEVYKEKKG